MWELFSEVNTLTNIYHVICAETDENINRYCAFRNDRAFLDCIIYCDGESPFPYTRRAYFRDKANYIATGRLPTVDYPWVCETIVELEPYLTLDELIDLVKPNTPSDIVDRLLEYVITSQSSN